MNRCGRCDGRLGRGAAFCPGCGAPVGDGELGFETASDGDGPRPPGPDVRFERTGAGIRRPWIGALAVTGLVAVVAISVTTGGDDGRGLPGTTSPDRPRPNVTTTATTATTATPDGVASVLTAPPPVVRSASTVPGPIRVGAGPLLGEASGLGVLVETGTRPALLDLDGGTLSWVPRSAVTENVDATPAGLAYHSGFGAFFLRRPDGTVASLGESGGEYLGEGPPGRAWFSRYRREAVGPQILFVDGLEAGVHEVPMPMAVGDARPDGSGGLVVGAPGGIYRLTVGGAPSRLATGSLVDAAGGFVLETACDDALHCRWVVHDLRRGTSRSLALPEGAGAGYGASLSPDGAWVSFLVARPGPPNGSLPTAQLVVVGAGGDAVDLGVVRSNGCLSRVCPGAPRWSPDGRWFVGVLDDRTLFAWRPGLPGVRIIALPAHGFDDEPTEVHGVSVDGIERLRAATVVVS